MVPPLTPTAAAMPLISEQAHAMICGFATFVRHPQDRALAQCCGCRLWRFIEPGRAR